MSLKLLGRVFDVQGLTPMAKNVLKSLANHAWDDGTHAHPSIGLIEHETSASRASVNRGLKELRETLFIFETGKTSLGVVIYRVDADRVEECAVEYVPKVRWGVYPETPQSQDEPTPAQSDTRTLSNSSDNENDKDFPEEVKELYEALRLGWSKSFPMRMQPRQWNTASQLLKEHISARYQEEDFRAKWRAVMWNARESKHLQNAGWFTLEYFTRNQDNWLKIAHGVFDRFDDELKQESRPQIVDARPEEA